MATEVSEDPPEEKTDYKDDALDPRVQVELEKLNRSSDDINKLELMLDEARNGFRQTLMESTQKMNALSKKLGSCIERARPYYDARMKAKEAQVETQNAALRFERACSQQAAAKEMVYLAEQGFFNKGQPFDPAWQEMLNHATMKVNEAERERLESEVHHQQTAMNFNEAEQRVKMLQRDLKRAINKSRPYFEAKARFNQSMEEQKLRVGELESMVKWSKKTYSEALHSLEVISDEIHQQRRDAKAREELGTRGTGVGAEAPSPPPERDINGKPIITDPLANKPVTMIIRTTNSMTQTDTTAPITTCVDSLSLDDEYMALPNATLRPKNGVKKVNKDTDRIDIQLSTAPCKSSAPKTLIDEFQPLPNAKAKNASTNTETKEPTPEGEIFEPYRRSVSEPLGPKTTETEVASPRTVPKFQVSMSEPGCISPTSLKTSPDNEMEMENSEQTKTNAMIMASLQKAKGTKMPFLRPNRSFDDLDVSDSESMTESMASVSVLDDEQIENLMLETGDFVSVLQASENDDLDSQKMKRRTLPARLSYLGEYVNFDPEWTEDKFSRGSSKVVSPDDTNKSMDNDKIPTCVTEIVSSFVTETGPNCVTETKPQCGLQQSHESKESIDSEAAIADLNVPVECRASHVTADSGNYQEVNSSQRQDNAGEEKTHAGAKTTADGTHSVCDVVPCESVQSATPENIYEPQSNTEVKVSKKSHNGGNEKSNSKENPVHIWHPLLDLPHNEEEVENDSDESPICVNVAQTEPPSGKK